MKENIISKINRIGALVFALALCVSFAIRLPVFLSNQFSQIPPESGSLFEQAKQVRADIIEQLAVPPNELFFKRLFWDYLQLTKRGAVNGLIILNNGHLTLEYYYDNAVLSAKADGLIELNDYLAARDIPFLFLRAPEPLRDNSQLPKGIASTVIEDTGQFMTQLKENGVDTLDLREVMTNENVDFSTAFFSGDFHWTAETALWAYGKTASLLNSEYGFSLDEKTWNPQEYESFTYKKTFDSLATRIGDPRLGEDITALIPRFSTEFTLSDINVNNSDTENSIIASGDFVDVFIPRMRNDNIDTLSYNDLNPLYSGPIRELHNLAAGEQKRVLLIADSFAFPYITYLATAFEYVDYLHLHNEENKKLYPLLNSRDYDLVLFLVYDGVLLNLNEPGFAYEQTRMYLHMP
jgi:hypothetical protein